MRALATATVFLVPFLAGCSDAPQSDALQDVLDYLAAQPAGTLPSYLVEVAVAAGLDASVWPPAAPALDQVRLPDANASLGSFLRPAFALSRLTPPPHAQEIRDRLVAAYDGTQFGTPDLLTDDMYALWTLSALVDDWSIAPWNGMHDDLRTHERNGGWSWSANATPDTDSTGMAISALVAVGAGGPWHVADFLATVHNEDGGFAAEPGGESNCDSTVWGIRAASLAGAPADAKAWDFLLALQRDDGGFAYLPRDVATNALCSAEAATLLADAQAGRVAGAPWP